jgi:hypothetical protein
VRKHANLVGGWVAKLPKVVQSKRSSEAHLIGA